MVVWSYCVFHGVYYNMGEVVEKETDVQTSPVVLRYHLVVCGLAGSAFSRLQNETKSI